MFKNNDSLKFKTQQEKFCKNQSHKKIVLISLKTKIFILFDSAVSVKSVTYLNRRSRK